ncbi:hypothetical protein [Peptoniphilus indolicus]|uniref:Fimbrial assembly protein (PilN) n=2 Tax=Peptoniphilus indolicus TaxID=33030 RepID=A0A379DFX6_9FIRM|nr:hypothetical protein [Peptoniphilus indolicus]SUB76173.1 Uncharacterised protein [Peptoniphilus indolicus]
MNKRTIFLFEDLKIFILNNFRNEIVLYPQLIENGEILDTNYVYYLMKKKIETLNIKNKVLFLVNSSKFLKFDIDVSNIKKDEYESYIYYELQKLVPTDMSEYDFTYEYDENLVNVRLVAKSFLDKYKDLAKNLNLKLEGVFYIDDVLIQNNYINYSLNRIKVIQNGLKKEIFSNELAKKFEMYDLSGEDISNLYLKKFVGIDSDIVEKLDELLQNLKYERINWLDRFASEKQYVYFGDLPIESLSKKYVFKNLEIDDINLKNNFIKSKNKNSVNIFLIIGALILLNLCIFILLNNRENKLKTEFSNSLKEIALEKDKNTTLKDDREKDEKGIEGYNKKFESLVENFENISNTDIFFEEYKFLENRVTIKGAANSTAVLEDLLKKQKNIKLISSSVRNGYLYFEIEVGLRDLDEDR